MLKVFKTLFVYLPTLAFIFLIPWSVFASGSPTFSIQTPANYATSSVGTAIITSVSSTVAIGAEHSLTFDWNRKLIGWWRFNLDSDVTDYSGTGNTLTNNGATWISGGKFGGAYAFDVATDYLGVTSSTYNLSSSDPYTISVWVKPNNTANATILNLGTDGSSGSYMGFLNGGAGGTVEYAMRQNYSGDWLGVTSVATISSSTWNHIVVTNDRTNLRIYINGALSNTQALGAYGSYTAVFNLLVGKNLWGDYFNGSIDDVQFYKRALATKEVSSLYNAQNTEYSSSFTLASSGTYLYRAYAQDTFGNVSSTEQRTLYVDVTPPTRTLTYSADSNGSISGSSSQIIIIGQNGSSVTAVPNDHFQFSSWSDSSLINPRTDTNVASNVSVTASFVSSTYSLLYSAGTGGILSGSSTQQVAYGTSGSAVSAIPNVGYAFSGWSDSFAVENRMDTNVSTNASYTANFTRTSSGGGASSAIVTTVPTVIMPPSFANGSLRSSVSNVFQMAVSKTENFEGISWEPYNESYQSANTVIYIKFRSPDGGVSAVFRVDPLADNTDKKIQTSQISSTASIPRYLFSKNLRRGMSGLDVKELQKYLNQNKFNIETKGPGSSGQESVYFGILTMKALVAFQKNYHLPPTGYFGPMTRSVINGL